MKKAILVLALFVGLKSFGQSDTTIVSQALGDSITIEKSAFEINPVIVTAQGDSARSMNWYAFGVTRDTTSGFNTYVKLFDSKGVQISAFNCSIPASIGNLWYKDPTPIDDYILSQNKRFSRP